MSLDLTLPADPFNRTGISLPKDNGPRQYFSKRMDGFNASVYTTWIERWARNSAMNYPVISRAYGVGFLGKAAKDIPCVVVGIGPSLDDNIKDLHNAQSCAIIIATDAALRPLLRHGIQPDLVVNYDARDEQKTMWETIDTSKSVLLANSVTSPKTIDAWKGGLIFFNMMQADDEFATNILPSIYPHIGQLPNMGTVGNGAVFLAWQMGCKPIMLVGMDLCYKAEEPGKWKYRCKDWRFIPPSIDLHEGAWEQNENKVLYDNDIRLKDAHEETIKGKTYMTDNCLKFYQDSLVNNIGRFDMPVINCSGGVLQDMVKTLPLRKALEGMAALTGGQTALKHLLRIIPDPKDQKSRVIAWDW
jgi:hypothetical protein